MFDPRTNVSKTQGEKTDLFKTQGQPPKTPYHAPWDNKGNQLPRNIPLQGPQWRPATTPTTLPQSKQGLAAAVVAQQYTQYEVHQREQKEGMYGEDKADRKQNYEDGELYAALVNHLKSMPDFTHYRPDHMSAVIKNVTNRLQQADLTINFNAKTWFKNPNNYNNYMQMYEKNASVHGGDGEEKEMHLKGNEFNKPAVRDAADTRIMFGANVASPEMQGFARTMHTGGVEPVPNQADTVKILNGQFNTKSRQVFAGLNYGRRPHGSAPQYGRDVLILHDHLKKDALYYMGDSFAENVTYDKARTHGLLFGVILDASEAAGGDLLDSCFRVMKLKDSEHPEHLLEAHIYGGVDFSNDVKEMIIEDFRISEQEKQNARDFADRHNIKLTIVPRQDDI